MRVGFWYAKPDNDRAQLLQEYLQMLGMEGNAIDWY